MKLIVNKQNITVVYPAELVASTENVYEAEYEFGEEWDGFQRTAVFEVVGGSSYQVVMSTDKCNIPNEVLTNSGKIRFGMLGTKTVGSITQRYPTVWSDEVYVNIPSAGSNTPTPPTPSVYAQILANEAQLGADIDALEAGKVDKIAGKGLSENDYSNTEKQKVADAYSDKHTHSNKSLLDAISSVLVDAWNGAVTWIATNGTNILNHLSNGSVHVTTSDKSGWNAKSVVTASASGSSTDEVSYITIDGVQKKIKGVSGGVDSVNGKTGNVVLDAEDVGALPSSTSIPTKTSDLTNDSGFLTEHQSLVGYATELWVEAKNYITNAVNNLTNYYLKSETYSKNEVDTTVSALQPKTDNLLSTVSKNVVGAINENKESIDNLKAIGRFLAVWNCTTGLPTTNPSTSPYIYKTGDYFLVGTVGTTNYKPNGSTYTIGVASTTVETNEVTVSDYYVYDGTDWILLKNTQKALTFANITGQPSDNSALNTALASKVGFTDYTGEGIAGVIKAESRYGVDVASGGYLKSKAFAYADYGTRYPECFISKTTLENVLDNESLRIDKTQTLSSAQKSQAYTNLGAVASQGVPIATSISSSSTHNEIPSAKAVYDFVMSLMG